MQIPIPIGGGTLGSGPWTNPLLKEKFPAGQVGLNSLK